MKTLVSLTVFYVLFYDLTLICMGFLGIRVIPLDKKWSFSLRISSVHVTKSARNCVFGHIYWRYP